MAIESTYALAHLLKLQSEAAIREGLRGINKHGPYNSFHESFAVLKEEIDELWDEIKAKDQDTPAIYLEAIQCAAVSLRIAAAAQRMMSQRTPDLPSPETKMTIQSNIERAAATAHEANRLYCISIGDNSHPHWEEAPDWQKKSAIIGAEMVFANPGITPEESHESWSRVKIAEGWVHGETKDPQEKTHPCLVPYADLPEEQRHKDYLFGSVVRAVLRLPQLGSAANPIITQERNDPNDPGQCVAETGAAFPA